MRPPRVELLTTGTELLLGDVVNTNAAALARQLMSIGLRIQRQTTVPDGPPIRDALAEALTRSDILLVTGGLGPTTDDVTRETASRLLGRPLQDNVEVAEAIRMRMQCRGLPLRERQLRQAKVPEGAQVLPNPHGTAPGLYLAPDPENWREHTHVFLLPGPPRELLPMFDNHVLPILRELAGGEPPREKRVYTICGLGESAVEEMIGLELSKRGDLEVGYCARPHEVELRLIGPREALEAVEPALRRALGENLVTKDRKDLAAVVLEALGARTLATAESCTGGLLASTLTDVPGASRNFLGGFVTYSNTEKVARLGVPAELIETRGAVSPEVAAAMADGTRAATGSDYAVALTGVAGPGGGTPEKPVGTLYIGIAGPVHAAEAFHEFLPFDRATFKQLAVRRALDRLRRALPACKS